MLNQRAHVEDEDHLPNTYARKEIPYYLGVPARSLPPPTLVSDLLDTETYFKVKLTRNDQDDLIKHRKLLGSFLPTSGRSNGLCGEDVDG